MQQQFLELSGKARFNKVRLNLIRDKMRSRGMSIRTLSKLLTISYERAKNLFKPPFHVSNELLREMESLLDISTDDVKQAFIETGLDLDEAKKLEIEL
ncbi:MAG: hypothetical protein LAT67_04960 [Balneolales bacterium]|nr:hypothetical protein [Balneolales bacterium]